MGKGKIDPAVGRRIAVIRKERRITQATVAEEIGVTVATIQNYEHGRHKVTDEQAEKIAAALNCTVADLYRANSAVPPLAIKFGRKGVPRASKFIRPQPRRRRASRFDSVKHYLALAKNARRKLFVAANHADHYLMQQLATNYDDLFERCVDEIRNC
jgi:transcriptional regulator with XRE-family HTH domain